MSLWYDSWMVEGPLCNMVDLVNISDPALKVRDVWQHKWDLDRLYTIIPAQVKDRINAIPFVENTALEDCMVWKVDSLASLALNQPTYGLWRGIEI